MLSIKEFVLVVHVTLEKTKVMQKLHGMNIIIQLKVQNYRNSFQETSATVLHGLSFQTLRKIEASYRSILDASYIAVWKRSDLNEQKNFERLVLIRNGVI